MSTVLVPPIAGAIPIVDTSSHNETDLLQIDWPTLATYLLSIHPEAGAIVKMGQGDGWYLNPYRHRQRWGAHAAGLKNVGLYWYVEMVAGGGILPPGHNVTGGQNAQAFLAAIGDDGGLVDNEFLAGDWEDQSAAATADLDAMALDFGGTLDRALGIEPILYSAEWYADPHNLEQDPALAQFPLWWAAWGGNTIPTVPEPWARTGKGISLWQFTTSATLPGMPFPCDVSWWLAGVPALRAIQWGHIQGPFQPGSPIPPPDIAINPVTQGAQDTTAAARHIATLGLQIAQLMVDKPSGYESAVGATAMLVYSDATAIVRNAGLLS